MKTQGAKAVAVGVVVGFLVAAFPSCGGKPASRCNSSICDGCCDETGACLNGTSLESCGSLGAACVSCTGGTTCNKIDSTKLMGGKCSTGGSGGGTGGGSGTGTCNSSTCASGCCAPSGTGFTCATPTPSKCGIGGAACVQCPYGYSCVNGSCAPCAGCIDATVNNGQCSVGNSNVACGTGGAYCVVCDANLGQACINSSCQGGACNATTCPDGCCNAGTCLPRSSFTNNQCGAGTPGGNCVSCVGGTCNLDAGSCVGGTTGGTGSIAELLLCNLVLQCTAGCCEPKLFGCTDPGNACKAGGTCDAASRTCK